MQLPLAKLSAKMKNGNTSALSRLSLREAIFQQDVKQINVSKISTRLSANELSCMRKRMYLRFKQLVFGNLTKHVLNDFVGWFWFVCSDHVAGAIDRNECELTLALISASFFVIHHNLLGRWPLETLLAAPCHVLDGKRTSVRKHDVV